MRKTWTTIGVVILAGCLCAGYFIAGAVVRSRAQVNCQVAARLIQGGNFQRASQSLDWLLWFEPHHPRAVYLTGTMLLADKEYLRAADTFRLVPESDPVSAEAQLGIIACFLADYRMEQAETALWQYVKRFPESRSAREQLSGLLMAQLRQRESVMLAREFVDSLVFAKLPFRERLRVLRDSARVTFDPPLPDSCLPLLQEADQRQPGQPTVVCALAYCSWKAGDIPAARKQFRNLLNSPTVHEKLQLAAADFFLETGESETADRIIVQLAEGFSPGNVQSTDRYLQYWSVRSRQRERAGEFGGALEYLDRMANACAADKEYHSRRARLLQRLDRADEARAAYSESHRLAELELRLWKLTRAMEELPSSNDCQELAELFAAIGNDSYAGAWQTIARETAAERDAAATDVQGAFKREQ